MWPFSGFEFETPALKRIKVKKKNWGMINLVNDSNALLQLLFSSFYHLIEEDKKSLLRLRFSSSSSFFSRSHKLFEAVDMSIIR